MKTQTSQPRVTEVIHMLQVEVKSEVEILNIYKPVIFG